MAQELQTEAELKALLSSVKRVAVLGIKTEAQSDQPAFYVPKYLKDGGLTVIPVPVYYPDVTTILGEKVYRKLREVPQPVDLVDVFRRPLDFDAHVEDLIALKPRAVWLQLGIRNNSAAKRLIEAGIDVVQDRCLMVEHRRLRSG